MNLYTRRPPDSVPTRTILGVAVAAPAWDEAIALLQARLADRTFIKVGFLNAHIANLASAEPRLAEVFRDFLVLPDGAGVEIASRLLYGKAFPANLNGTDFVPALLAATATPLSVGLLGARRANVEGAAAELARRAPQHRYTVVSDGFFAPADEPAILERLADLRPDVLLVALGVPKQEFFIADRIDERHATMTFAVGALFDFLSGAVPRAPLVMQRLRLEWLFRLAVEPGRLWRRYVVGNPAFLLRVMRQWMRRP